MHWEFIVEVRDSLNGIFGSWARWTRAPPDVQSCWDVVAVAAVTFLGRLTPLPDAPLSRPAGLQDSLAGLLACLLDG